MITDCDILTKGTKLINKRSRNQFTIVDVLPALGPKTNWQVLIEYRCFSVLTGNYKYILETELDKYEVTK